MLNTLEYKNGVVKILDQTRLPLQEIYLNCRKYQKVGEAIKKMQVRGAPAIGIAAAMGIALGAEKIRINNTKDFLLTFEKICNFFSATRPTAVNLSWAIARMRKLVSRNQTKSVKYLKKILKQESLTILKEDININKNIGIYGNELLKSGDKILTHCNAGALATGGYGTALGVIRSAHKSGKKIKVYVDETRPYLQGSRLTAWELKKEKIPFTLITDNMAGYFMQRGEIDLVLLGADRIAANGDVANKIGTYSLAVLAKEHKLPFYVAAPLSTFDLSLSCGEKIPIEEREAKEVTHLRGLQITPSGVKVANPAFDLTPHKYIRGIITEQGVIKPPYKLRTKIKSGVVVQPA